MWVTARQAIRFLSKNPGATFAASGTLALVIGVNSAIFTLANALIFANMPVPHADRLVEISTVDRKGERGYFSIPTFQRVQQQAGVFDSAFAWVGGGMENLEMNKALFAGPVDEVAGDYYEALGIRAAVGRLLTREDKGAVAVIGYRAWQEYFLGDPGVLGRAVRINGRAFVIVGVHPRTFPGLIREVAAIATVPTTALNDRTKTYYTVIGRLRDGVTEGQARVRIETVWPAIRMSTAPDGARERGSFLARRVQVQRAARGVSYMRDRFTKPLSILFGIAGMLLALACVNLACVALARADRRAAEYRIRAALGATRWRLARASLIESLVLALGGAIPGLALAYWGADYLAHFMWRGYVPLAVTLAPDVLVVLFTAAVAVLAGVLSGVVPALRAANPQAGARTTGNTGKALVAAQISLSFAILAGALVLSRSVANLVNRDFGFNSDRLLIAQLFPRGTYKGFDNATYFRQLLASLRSMPGVTSATIAKERPIGTFVMQRKILPAGVAATLHQVGPEFFETLGMRILRGRDFDSRDDESHPAVAIVSSSLARALAPSGDAIGRVVKIGEEVREIEIVGIAGDATLDDPRRPDAPAIYTATFQRLEEMGWSNAIIRTDGDPAAMGRELRRRIESLGREYPLRIETVEDELAHALVPERVLALLSGSFGALALLLASIGLYGLLSYTVSRRTREIGVRVALGASEGAIAELILRDAAIMLALGLAAGMVLAWIGSGAIVGSLYGVSGHYPGALGWAAGVMVVVAACASLVPSMRAARLDPMAALREE